MFSPCLEKPFMVLSRVSLTMKVDFEFYFNDEKFRLMNSEAKHCEERFNINFVVSLQMYKK
jgi:hypothetical protein